MFWREAQWTHESLQTVSPTQGTSQEACFAERGVLGKSPLAPGHPTRTAVNEGGRFEDTGKLVRLERKVRSGRSGQISGR